MYQRNFNHILYTLDNISYDEKEQSPFDYIDGYGYFRPFYHSSMVIKHNLLYFDYIFLQHPVWQNIVRKSLELLMQDQQHMLAQYATGYRVLEIEHNN
jgi:CRISPR/Cas system endoribonuclease Cas6 (RAMP superfamily)